MFGEEVLFIENHEFPFHRGGLIDIRVLERPRGSRICEGLLIPSCIVKFKIPTYLIEAIYARGNGQETILV